MVYSDTTTEKVTHAEDLGKCAVRACVHQHAVIEELTHP